MNDIEVCLLKLIGNSFGVETSLSSLNDSDCNEILKQAYSHNVLSLVIDGIKKNSPHFCGTDMWFEWVGKTMVLEQKYNKQLYALEKISDLFEHYNIPFIVLKGVGLSINYPNPSYRTCGDIDIYTYHNKKRVDELMDKNFKIDVTKGYEKHSSFLFYGVNIENHSVLFDEQSHPINRSINQMLDELTYIEKEEIIIGGKTINIPNPTLMAMHVLRHTACDFASNTISLRQILDWASLVNKREKEIDWSTVLSFVNQTNMMDFFVLINTACMRWFEFYDGLSSYKNNDNIILNRFCKEVFHGKRVGDFPNKQQKLLYGIKKTVQFWHNVWKYKMVYGESSWKIYYTLVHNRLKH